MRCLFSLFILFHLYNTYAQSDSLWVHSLYLNARINPYFKKLDSRMLANNADLLVVNKAKETLPIGFGLLLQKEHKFLKIGIGHIAVDQLENYYLEPTSDQPQPPIFGSISKVFSIGLSIEKCWHFFESRQNNSFFSGFGLYPSYKYLSINNYTSTSFPIANSTGSVGLYLPLGYQWKFKNSSIQIQSPIYLFEAKYAALNISNPILSSNEQRKSEFFSEFFVRPHLMIQYALNLNNKKIFDE